MWGVLALAIWVVAGPGAMQASAGASWAWQPMWLLSGLALVAVLLWGPGIWPGLLLGGVIGYAVHGWQWGAAGGALALAAVFGAWLARRLTGTRRPVSTPRELCLLAVAAGVSAAVVSAPVATTAAAMTTPDMHAIAIAAAWVNGVLASVVGTLIVASLLLSATAGRPPRRSLNQALLSTAVAVLTVCACYLIFSGILADSEWADPLLAVLLVPMLLWTAYRLRVRGTALVVGLLVIGIVHGSFQGYGPFPVGESWMALLMMQLFIVVIVLTGLTFATALDDNERTHRMLTRTLARSDKRVRERTAELLAVNRTLSNEITRHTRTLRLSRGRTHVLELIATGAPLERVLACLVAETESVQSGLTCVAMVTTPESHRWRIAAAPGVSSDLAEAVRDAVQQRCQQGIRVDERCLVADVRRHPQLAMLQGPAGRAGVRAAWWEPVAASDGTLLGAFMLLRRCPGPPSAYDLEVLDAAARLAGLAVERKRVDDQLHELANRDRLTGLLNRAAFSEALASAVSHAERSGERVGLLFFDLDGFKQINDSVGHAAGDELLTRVAQRLRECTRAEDRLGRLGGDEFTVAVADAPDAHGLRHLAEKLLAELAAPYSLQGGERMVTPSIGISVYPDDAASADELLRQADMAMYCSKRSGGAVAHFFAARMNEETRERMRLEAELREALCRDELVLYFQPQWSLRTGEMTGVEALLRWTHPTRGLLSPSAFLPAVESCALSRRIGRWVMEHAVTRVAAWEAQGTRPLRLSVNISPAHLRAPEFLDDLDAVFSATTLAAERVELEVSETGLGEAGARLSERFDGCRARGIRFAINEFGIGSASLARLRTCPVSRLKIDRAFVSELSVESSHVSLMASMVGLAHNLGLSVTAEGVETGTQCRLVRDSGCDEVQGRYLGVPVCADAFLDIHRRQLRPPAANERPIQRIRPLADERAS